MKLLGYTNYPSLLYWDDNAIPWPSPIYVDDMASTERNTEQLRIGIEININSLRQSPSKARFPWHLMQMWIKKWFK